MTLPKDLQAKWDRACATGEPVDVERFVICDACSGDYTDRQEVGGFILGGSAYCPACAERSMPSIIEHGEEKYIRALCPAGWPFANFVRAYRKATGSTTIRFHKGD